MKIVTQANEHLVSQSMQEKSKLVGQESMTAESVHTQMILEGLDEALGLPSVCVVGVPTVTEQNRMLRVALGTA